MRQRTVTVLKAECAAAFDKWWDMVCARAAAEGKPPASSLVEDALRFAFIAGFESGGKVGARMMLEEAVRSVKELARTRGKETP